MAQDKKNSLGSIVILTIICMTLFGVLFAQSADAGGGTSPPLLPMITPSSGS
ncbi:MAG: hypothetical protein K8F91_20555 [Candidatus Obscuribacterales bacterium]|nr:hypothetical protein [Candidatus Obscuribacterales bacterium]